MSRQKPFIAYELDAMDRVPLIAQLAGVSEEKVGWGMPRMWRYCWKESVDVVTLRMLQALFAVNRSQAQEVAYALEDNGFVEAMEEGLVRVKGAGRYLRLTEAKVQAGRARATKAVRAANGRFVSAVVLEKSAGSGPFLVHRSSSETPAAVQQTPAGVQQRSSSYSEQRTEKKEDSLRDAAVRAVPVENQKKKKSSSSKGALELEAEGGWAWEQPGQLWTAMQHARLARGLPTERRPQEWDEWHSNAVYQCEKRGIRLERLIEGYQVFLDAGAFEKIQWRARGWMNEAVWEQRVLLPPREVNGGAWTA